MSKTLTFTAITTLISLHLSNAEILSCNAAINPGKRCGPCTETGLCRLKCIGQEDICTDSILQCKSGEQCQMDCLAGYACSGAVMDASLATSLSLTCDIHTSCEDTNVNLGIATNLDVTCTGTEATCKSMNINGQFAGNITVNCNSYESCTGLTVNAGNAENVAVNCNDNGGAVCNGLRLFCGTGDCSITCDGVNKCSSINVVTGTARSFTCVGTAAECQSAPANYAPPTHSPTAPPTTSPTLQTINPTNNPSIPPTKTPSNTPSTAPTPKPSISPSFQPTAHPITSKPSINPTISPTNKPSMLPTPSPTNKPTRNPTPKPTVNPTNPSLSPSHAPTKQGQTYQPTLSPTKQPITSFPTEFNSSSSILPPSNTPNEEDNAPTPSPSTSYPTTTAQPSTLPPTSDQSDDQLCCECIQARKGNKGCVKDPQCTEKICDIDPYCCENQWDNTCAYYATDQCTKSKQTPSPTTNVKVQEAPSDLDLVWKFALVVFAIMVLIVSCCIILLRIHRMCQNCKHRKLAKEKSLSARKVKRRKHSSGKGRDGGLHGVGTALVVPPVNTPANSIYSIASIKSGTHSTYSKKKLDEESRTFTHAEDVDDDDEDIDHMSVPVKRVHSKNYLKRYYGVKSMHSDARSTGSNGFSGGSGRNGHYFSRHPTNTSFVGDGVGLEFGDDLHKEDRFMINHIVNARDNDDEDSLSMTDDTNFVIHAANTFSGGKRKRRGKKDRNKVIQKQPTESHHSTETSVGDEEESDVEDEDEDEMEEESRNHHHERTEVEIVDIKAVMNKHEMDDGRPSILEEQQRLKRTSDRRRDGVDGIDGRDDRLEDTRNDAEDSDDTDESIMMSHDPISEIMTNLRRYQSSKHHSI